VNATSRTLPNGLQVYIVPSTAAPLASIYLWLDAGSVDEGPAQHGAAHFLEHMLFKGTPRRGLTVAAATIEGMGGELNAYTAPDQTVVHATVESLSFAEALDVVVDMVRYATIDPDEFDREKLVILEEIRSYMADPEVVVEDAVNELLYPDHPYERPVLGTLESVRAMTHADLCAYRAAHHGSNRAVLAVAGDVDPEAVFAQAEALLGDWAAASKRTPLAVSGAPAGPYTRKVTGSFESRVVELSWHLPPLGHPDLPALDVLTTALGGTAAATLTEAVQRKAQAATEPWAALSPRAGGSSLSIGLLPREGRSLDALRATLAALEDVTRSGLSGTLVARAREGLLADTLFQWETVGSQAHSAAYGLATYGEANGEAAYYRAVAAVTPDDVRRAARRWLRRDNLAVVALDPDVDADELRAVVEAPPATTKTAPRGVVARHTLANGARIIVLPDDRPVVAVRLLGAGGALAETQRTAGVSAAWSAMIGTSAGERDVHRYAEALDAIAGSLSGMAGRNTIGLHAAFPADHAMDGLSLLGDTVVEPNFDEDEWERVREELIEEVHTLPDRPGTVGAQAMWSALWPSTPWRLPRDGAESALNRLRPATLTAWHERQFTGNNLVFAVAGRIDPDQVFAQAEEWLGALPAGEPVAPPDTSSPARGGTRRRTAGQEQTLITIGMRGASIGSPDSVPLTLASGILGGQGGRLFLALRERLGLAYSVWALSHEGLGGGVFEVGLATDPKRAALASRALHAELERTLAEPPTAEEVERVRRMLIGQAAMALQRVSGRAGEMAVGERFNLPWGYERTREVLEATSAERVAEVLHDVLNRTQVRVIVRPEDGDANVDDADSKSDAT